MPDTSQPSLFGDACTTPRPAAPRRSRAPIFHGVREITLAYRNRPDLRHAPTKITNAGDVASLCDWLRDLPHEEAWVIALNASTEILGIFQVGRGGLTDAPVAPSEIYRTALLVPGAAAVLLTHNHPSGHCSPSADDRKLTQSVVAAGELLGVPLVDHVILGLHDHYSFANERLISEYRSAATRRLR